VESAYRVAVVVDPEFGERLASLAERMHVWVADTPANRIVAERIWAATAAPSIERGVTTFRINRSEPSDAWAANILPDVELHHGEYSHKPAVDTLEIHGATLSARLRLALGAAGFTHLDDEGMMIVASRPPAV
jgi:hypothetical protein